MNYMIVQITPPAIANIGWKTYIIFAILNTVWLPIIYFLFPETKGKLFCFQSTQCVPQSVVLCGDF